MILLALVPLLFLGLLYFYPLSAILGASLGQAVGSNPWLDVAASPGLRAVIGFTIWQAAISTALTLLLGLPGAYILAHYDFRGKRLFRALTAVPFVMPTLVVATAFSALLGPSGLANSALMAIFGLDAPPIGFMNTFAAIVNAHVFYNLTIVLRLVGDYWGRLNPRLAQAAQVLGASRREAFRRVTLPLLSPALLAAALLIFIFDFSSFAVVLVLGGLRYSTIEVEIFYQATALGNLPVAAVLSIIQLIFTLAFSLAYVRLSRALARPTAQRAGRPLRPLPSARSHRGWALRLVLLIILALTTAPLAALALRSLVNLAPVHTRTGALARGLTFAFYGSLLDPSTGSDAWRAAGVSLAFAALTVALALLLGLPTAWLLARKQLPRLARILDPLLMLPLGTSAVTLGLGFIVALNRPPLDLRASPLLVPLAHTLVAFPFVVRSMTPALTSIQPRLRQAAAVLGASPWDVIRTIDLPLVGRAVAVAAAFAFSISLGEFGATALVTRPEYQTVPTVIYRLLGRPGALNFGQALALSTVLMLLTLGAMLAIERFRVQEGSEF